MVLMGEHLQFIHTGTHLLVRIGAARIFHQCLQITVAPNVTNVYICSKDKVSILYREESKVHVCTRLYSSYERELCAFILPPWVT
jgi:hypothetical protein